MIMSLPLLFLASGVLAGETAISMDGKWLALANNQPYKLVIMSRENNDVVRVFEVEGRHGDRSRVEGVYADPTRNNFIVTLRDVAEYWLIATDPNAPPVYDGFVHSREPGMVEGFISSQGLFARRRVEISTPLSELVFSSDYRTFTGLTPDGISRTIVNLNVNREIGSHRVKPAVRPDPG